MTAAATRADALRMKVSGVEITHLRPIRTLPGVVPLAAAARNGPGAGRLHFDSDPARLTWQSPGSAIAGLAVDVSAGGDFLLQDGEDPDAWLRVTVYPADLPAVAAETRVLLGDVYENGVSDDDVTAAEAAAGDVETYQIDLGNDSPVGLSHVKAWLDAATEDLEISDDGIDWVSPTSEPAALDLGDIPGGGEVPLHLRRTIAPAAESDPDVLNLIHVGFDGI